MLGWCPNCEQLVGISPTREKQSENYSSEWQRVDMHAAPDPDNPGQKRVCPGSGRKI